MTPCYSCHTAIGWDKANILHVIVTCENRKVCERKGKQHLVCGKCFHLFHKVGLLTDTHMMAASSVPIYTSSVCPTPEALTARRMMA